MAIRTPAQALALLRKRGVIMQAAAVPGVPSLAAEVAGEAIRGSWWGHPEGKRIYALAEALHESGEVLPIKLCGGKVTLVHRRLWPAVYRVVTDPAFRSAASAGLAPPACRLLERVEAAGEARLDDLSARAATCGTGDRRAALAAKDELEVRLLVMSEQVHGDRGNHVTVLRTWSRWVPQDVELASRGLDLASASAAIRGACGEAPLRIDPPRAGRATRRKP